MWRTGAGVFHKVHLLHAVRNQNAIFRLLNMLVIHQVLV
jgi:hypothetical protein